MWSLLLIMTGSFLVASYCDVTQAKKLGCTTSGHVCRHDYADICHDEFAFVEGPCELRSPTTGNTSKFLSKHCDYCPDTHTPPQEGASALAGPCRTEDGYYRCPPSGSSSSSGDGSGNCVRRSTLNRLQSPSGACSYDVSIFLPITCTDDEVGCKINNRCIRRYEVTTVFGCEFVTRAIYVRCHETEEFECAISKRCIPRHWVRDGSVDCSFNDRGLADTSDEDSPLLTCNASTEFRCSDTSGRCLSREMVRNNITECQDGSDEHRPPSCHPQTEFQCPDTSGRCLPRYRVNDGYDDCPEAGDHDVIDFKCHPETEYECAVSGDRRRCIPRTWMPDSIVDCKMADRSECRSGEFRCRDGSRCIADAYLCDGIQNCDDCSDEVEACDEPRRFRCATNTSVCLPWAYTCDGSRDCADGSDESTRVLPGFKCDAPHARCHVPQFLLDPAHPPFCADSSDRCYDNATGEFVCARCLDNRTIISRKQLCDGKADCPDLSDECCCEETPAKALCDVIYGDGVLRHRTDQVCDGHADWTDGLDERFCYQAASAEPGKKFECRKEVKEKDFRFKYHTVMATYCDGVLECPFRDDECSGGCEYEEQFCGKRRRIAMLCDGGNVLLEHNQVCDGIQHCKDGRDESDCDGRFKCSVTYQAKSDNIRRLSLALVSIPAARVCDFRSDCDDGSDEWGCPGRFYCVSGEPLYVNKSAILDGKFDCVDNSDECHDDPNDPESLHNDIIGHTLVKWWTLLVGGLSLIANVWVIVYSTGEIRRMSSRCELHPQFPVVSVCNRFFVINIAIADLLMAVSLMTIGATALRYHGHYCMFSFRWRVSTLCNVIGVATLTSLQVTVNLLTALTVLRLLVLLNPAYGQWIRMRRCSLVVAAIWIEAFGVGLIPILFESNFAKSRLLAAPSPFFARRNVSAASLDFYVTRSTEILATHGGAATDIADFPSRRLEMLGGFGYFSKYGICFADVFITDAETNSTFSLFLAVYNSLALSFIVVCYVVIYRKSLREKTADVTSHRQVMKRRVSMLLLTNAVCWLPIFVLSLVGYANLVKSTEFQSLLRRPEDYAYLAVILLPANSLLNPIIYSRLHRQVLSKVKKFLPRGGAGDGASVAGGEQYDDAAQVVYE